MIEDTSAASIEQLARLASGARAVGHSGIVARDLGLGENASGGE